jgi:hypothetical protein
MSDHRPLGQAPHSLLQIVRVETLGEQPVHRSENIMGLLPFALIAEGGYGFA